ncbi:MAG TPA: DivIVA domain-containing protein [Pseudolysinimonas sp.]|nr:DivIVA domain-containing protein [Pseudolysinimonas sp.]
MALTPEDVVNKRFNPTKFREGYDQDEVDDFLDEVVVELRRLNQENEELRQRLVASEARINELQRGGTPQSAAAVAPAPAPVAAPEPVFAPQPAAAEAMDPGNTNNLLQLARRLHEEHVREGMEKRDALIAEGHATAARVVSEAEQTQRAQLGRLEQERVVLERRVEELRNFEREYRQKLRSYIEGQLHELESANALTAAPESAPIPTQDQSDQEPEPAAAAPYAGQPAAQPAYQGSPQAAPAYPGAQPSGGFGFPSADYQGFASGN